MTQSDDKITMTWTARWLVTKDGTEPSRFKRTLLKVGDVLTMETPIESARYDSVTGHVVIDGTCAGIKVSYTVPPEAALTIEYEPTGHGRQIDALRAEAGRLHVWEDDAMDFLAVRLRAAAALLECHDATGINLTNDWAEVEAFVNQQIDSLAAGLGHVRDNGA